MSGDRGKAARSTDPGGCSKRGCGAGAPESSFTYPRALAPLEWWEQSGRRVPVWLEQEPWSFCGSVPPSDLVWARSGSGDPGDAVHGFVDDWRLESLWRGNGFRQDALWYTEPDFSVVASMPIYLVAWQVYRARAIGCALRARGVQVVPVLQFGSAAQVPYCSAFIRRGSVLAVRAPSRDVYERSEWLAGLRRAYDLLEPVHFLVFGRVGSVALPLSRFYSWSSVPLRRGRDGKG